MFHDTNLKDSAELVQLMDMAFDLNAYAVRLALLVQWAKRRGEITLPVQYLKRLGFTRRQWELATKGSREYDGCKLVDPRPAKDGLEATGMISEVTERMSDGRKRTYWVIGKVDQAALEAIRHQREAAEFDVIEDRKDPEACRDGVDTPVIRNEPDREKEVREAHEQGYALGWYERGEAARGDLDYLRGVIVELTGCLNATCLEYNDNTRGVANRHPVEDNPNAANLSALLSEERAQKAKRLEVSA